MRPTVRESDQDAAGTGEDFIGHFDPPSSPSAGLTFPSGSRWRQRLKNRLRERSASASAGSRSARSSKEGGGVFVAARCGRVSRFIFGSVQAQPEEVGQEAVIAQAICAQAAFEFLVAVLAFVAFSTRDSVG